MDLLKERPHSMTNLKVFLLLIVGGLGVMAGAGRSWAAMSDQETTLGEKSNACVCQLSLQTNQEKSQRELAPAADHSGSGEQGPVSASEAKATHHLVPNTN